MNSISIYGGAILLLLMLICLLLGSAALVLKWNAGNSRGEDALDIFTVAIALAIFIVELLGYMKLLNLAAVLTSCLMIGAGGWYVGKRAAWNLLSQCARAGLDSVRRSPLLSIIALLGIFTAVRGLSIPQLSWDGVTYHLGYPASWIKNGGFVRFEGGGCWENYENYPKGGETLFFLSMLPFGRDYLVNLTNLPLWLGMAVAIRASGKRLGLRSTASDGMALIITACPVFYSYITPAYVEVLTGFAFSAVLNAAIRSLRGYKRAWIPLGIAFGIALSTKLTLLSWFVIVFMIGLFSVRQDLRSTLRYATIGLLGGGALGLPWYVYNIVICSNPIYPAALPGVVTGPGAGSQGFSWPLLDSSVVGLHAFGVVIDYLLEKPWEVRYPLGPNWIYPLSIIATPLLLFFAKGARSIAAVLLWLLSLYLLYVYVMTPWNGFYFKADTRFLGPSLIAAVAACGVSLVDASAFLSRFVGTVALVVTAAFVWKTPTLNDFPWTSPATVIGICLLIALYAAIRRPRLAALGYVAAFLLLPITLNYRESGRFKRYMYDLHPLPSCSTALWETVAKLPRSRIAFVAGGVDSNEAWFFYPLFGPDLRHDVRYVDIEKDGELRSCQRRGRTRDQPDREAWLARMARLRINYLLIAHDSIEGHWATSMPEHFTLLSKAGCQRLFKFTL